MKRLLSIPLRVLLPVLLLGCAATAGLISWQLNTRLLVGEIESQFLAEARLRITALQRNVEYLIRKSDAVGLKEQMTELVTRNDVIAAFVLDRQDCILAATEQTTVGDAASVIEADLPEDLKGRRAAQMAQVRDSTLGNMALSQDRRIVVAYYPLLVDVDDHALRLKRNGLVVLVLDMQISRARASQAARRQALHHALVFGGLAGGAWVFIHLSLTRRVAGLVTTTRELASGNLTARTGIEGSDELAQVARAIDLMADRLLTDITERKQAEDALRESKRFIESITDAAANFIYVFDLETGTHAFTNRSAMEFLGYSQAQILELGTSFLPAIVHPDDLPGLAQRVTQIAGAPDGAVIEYEYRVKHASGDWRWVWTRDSIFKRRPNGVAWQIIGVAQDITRRKQAEDDLEKLHKEHLGISRQAGMAEIATSVLHNVGNVLNSVNVSAELLREQISKTPVADLGRVVALLQERVGNLSAFFTEDPRGSKVPEFLGKLAAHFSRGQETQLKEVVALQKNVEHIKEIVAMQQSYARVSGVTESLQVTDLVEDALRMNGGAFQRHAVQVVREWAPGLPAVITEKHKVLQILVNLLSNAKYACDGATSAEKHITVRVAHADDRLRVEVIDNGVGIAAENLDRIFNHGFTTKSNGHGFGLHSAANAATEMGGSLTVHSDGTGQGATFTLELPLNARTRTPPASDVILTAPPLHI